MPSKSVPAGVSLCPALGARATPATAAKCNRTSGGNPAPKRPVTRPSKWTHCALPDYGQLTHRRAPYVGGDATPTDRSTANRMSSTRTGATHPRGRLYGAFARTFANRARFAAASSCGS